MISKGIELAALRAWRKGRNKPSQKGFTNKKVIYDKRDIPGKMKSLEKRGPFKKKEIRKKRLKTGLQK